METIDYTTRRLNSRCDGARIVKCPKCGRKGKQCHWLKGGGQVIHKGDVRGWPGFSYVSVTDLCMVPKEIWPPLLA